MSEPPSSKQKTMATTPPTPPTTVGFDHVAREWRMKYSEGGLKGGAVTLDTLLKDTYLSCLEKVPGFVSCDRVVCGGCNDFKVVIKVKKEMFGDWEKLKFAPESEFLEAAKLVGGVSQLETQTYTFDSLSSLSTKPGKAAFTLTYFPIMAKGLGPALCAEYSGLAWKGPMQTGWTKDKWASQKKDGTSPFGQLPMLTDLADGGAPIGQTTAIVNYIGHLGGASLEGSGRDWVTSQMLVATAEDLYTAMQKSVPTLFVKVGDKGGKAGYDTFWNSTLTKYLKFLEPLCIGTCGFTGTGRTVGELQLFAYMHQMECVKAAFITASFPKVTAWFKSVTSDARTVKVLTGKSGFGTVDPYFKKIGEGGNGWP